MTVLYIIGALLVAGIAKATDPVHHNAAVIKQVSPESSPRIIAGWEAADGQVPHQVSLRMVSGEGLVYTCGGSVIHHRWVITAAHCVANRYTIVVRFGLTNLTRPEYIVESRRKHIYPGYAEAGPEVQPDDIALVGVDHHIPYGPYIQPCRLQNSGEKDTNYLGTVFTVSGFGRTNDPWLGGAPTEKLRWVYLRGMPNEECARWYDPGVVTEVTICAHSYNDTAQSTCQGDSGGPLTFVDVDGRPTMVGVVSFVSIFGCNNLVPSGYVRPGYYHAWYQQVTGINFDWRTEDIRSRYYMGD